jgi:hypothetical protein
MTERSEVIRLSPADPLADRRHDRGSRSELRSWTWSAALLLLVVLLAAAGCGVPGESDPFEEGPAPGAGDPVNRAGTVRLPTREGATTTLELARRFLQAGAGANWDPEQEESGRFDEAKAVALPFLVPEQRRIWTPTNQVVVVDVQLTESLDSVTAVLTPFGELEASGMIEPLSGSWPQTELRFQAETVNGSLMLNLAPQSPPIPQYWPLSLDGLGTLFEDRPVYFWDKSGQFLVPDRRYVSRGISDEKRVRAIVDQLQAGPSNFLKGVVNPLPVNTTLDNPELNEDLVRVNFPPIGQEPNHDDALRRIARQIRWSVHRPGSSPRVQILEAGRAVYTDEGDEYLKANPSQRIGPGTPDETRLFAIQNGKVVPVSSTASSPSILQQEANTDVVLAAVNRPNNDAALVRQIGGRPQLWLSRGDAELRIAPVDFPGAKAMSRPSFVPGTDGRVLIAVDNVLYDVAPDGGAQQIRLSLDGAVTAVSVAPDGARVALVVGGHAVVAPMDATTATVNIGTLRPLYVLPGVAAVGVGWLYEDRLVVSGASAMAEVAIDNGRVEGITPANLAAAQVTQLSAVPGNPLEGTRGSVVVEDNSTQQAYYAYSSGLEPIRPLGSPSPAPSASGGTNAAPPKLRVPFYVDEIK